MRKLKCNNRHTKKCETSYRSVLNSHRENWKCLICSHTHSNTCRRDRSSHAASYWDLLRRQTAPFSSSISRTRTLTWKELIPYRLASGLQRQTNTHTHKHTHTHTHILICYETQPLHPLASIPLYNRIVLRKSQFCIMGKAIRFFH